MCFFKKRTPKIEGNLFKEGDFVTTRYRDELVFGYIYTIKLGPDGKIVYDVQLGGQCPCVIYNIPEETIRLKKAK